MAAIFVRWDEKFVQKRRIFSTVKSQSISHHNCVKELQTIILWNMWKNVAKASGLASWLTRVPCSHCPRRQYSSKSDLDVIVKKMKLRRYRCFAKSEESLSGLEPLKTIYEELDAFHVRKRQPHVLFVRSELMLQRLEYLKPSGILARQKRKIIQRSPPVLVFTEDSRNNGTLNYLRGVIRVRKDGAAEEKIHLLHPCSKLLVMRTFDLENRVKLIMEELRMARQSALKMLLELPCFLLHTPPKKFVVTHKYDLPIGYSLDQHTAKVYPPVYSSSLEINPRLFRRDSDEKLAQSFPTLMLNDLLDYSYPKHYGEGQPEDLTKFLINAERRELREKYNKVM